VTSIDVVINRVLDATKAKATIQDCSAVFFIALPETWILVQLSKNLIQSWHLHLPWQAVQLIVNLFIG
jgi:hypothetical protein